MKKIYISLFLFFPSAICHFPSAFASDNSPLGSRSSGIGNASVSLSDLWSVQNNQAGLGFVKKINAGVFYQNQFALKELSTKAFAFTLPVKSGTFGLCVSNFGYSLYSENKYGLSFGKSFGEKISAGISMDYLSTNISEYGKKKSFVAEIGIQAKPIKNLTMGVHIFNPTRTKLASYNDERIPTIMRLGFDYKFSEKVFVALETEKDIEKKGMVKAGLEYKLIKELYLRAGVSTNPSLSCFGIGINLKQFRLDISSAYHSTLGFSPQVGLIYQFGGALENESK
ncbi:MAG: hypothetical protein AABZ32_04945 [Bacteroidota bacterium]